MLPYQYCVENSMSPDCKIKSDTCVLTRTGLLFSSSLYWSDPGCSPGTSRHLHSQGLLHLIVRFSSPVSSSWINNSPSLNFFSIYSILLILHTWFNFGLRHQTLGEPAASLTLFFWLLWLIFRSWYYHICSFCLSCLNSLGPGQMGQLLFPLCFLQGPENSHLETVLTGHQSDVIPFTVTRCAQPVSQLPIHQMMHLCNCVLDI